MIFFINQNDFVSWNLKKIIIAKKNPRGISCGFICGNAIFAKFPTDLSAKSYFLGNFLRVLLRNYLQIFRRKICYVFVLVFGRKFRRKISCGFQKSQETITYKGFSWEPKSAGNSAGNVFPADFLPKSAGNRQISSSVYLSGR
jgi:hypothetical protein